MRSLPEQAVFMDKWSNKPANHNADRVRNNQRRHRARVKSRMEELETQLVQTNSKLQAALSTILDLTAEVEVLRSGHASTSVSLSETRPPVPDLRPHDTTPTPSEGLSLPFASTSELSSPSADITIATPADASSDGNCDCPGAPPPALGESTISCSSAFQIIEQQNCSGVEVTMIRAWLGPGFRLKPGEACRVETNKLYEILDHITSPL